MKHYTTSKGHIVSYPSRWRHRWSQPLWEPKDHTSHTPVETLHSVMCGSAKLLRHKASYKSWPRSNTAYIEAWMSTTSLTHKASYKSHLRSNAACIEWCVGVHNLCDTKHYTGPVPEATLHRLRHEWAQPLWDTKHHTSHTYEARLHRAPHHVWVCTTSETQNIIQFSPSKQCFMWVKYEVSNKSYPPDAPLPRVTPTPL